MIEELLFKRRAISAEIQNLIQEVNSHFRIEVFTNDALANQIDTTPETLAKWLVKMFGLVNSATEDTCCAVELIAMPISPGIAGPKTRSALVKPIFDEFYRCKKIVIELTKVCRIPMLLFDVFSSFVMMMRTTA